MSVSGIIRTLLEFGDLHCYFLYYYLCLYNFKSFFVSSRLNIVSGLAISQSVDFSIGVIECLRMMISKTVTVATASISSMVRQ